MSVPHYQGFTNTIPLLAAKGVQFVDVAGNNEILLTAVAPHDWTDNLPDGALLFSMNMVTSSSTRVALQVPVQSLTSTILTLKAQGLRIEHLYDY